MAIMKKVFFLIIILMLSISVFSQELIISEKKIENGPNIVFIKGTQSEYVSLCVFVALNEDTPGIGHLAEHIVFASNEKMKAGEFDRLCESLGSTCDAYTNYDYSVYKIIIKKDHLPLIIEYLSNALLQENPTEQELSLEKSIIKDEFSRKLSIGFDYIKNKLNKALYGDTYYGNPIEGEDISNISIEDLKSYYSNNYISKNMSFVIYGNIDEDNTLEIIKKYFTQKDKNSFNMPIEYKLHSKEILEIGQKNYYGIVFNLAPSINIGEAMVCDVLSQLVENLSSNTIREKYKYKSEYIHNTGKYASPFMLIYEGDDIDYIKESILQTVDYVQKGNFDNYDLLNAKSVILSDFLAKNTQIDNVAYNTGFNYLMYNFETVYSYDKYINSVTKDDVMKMANKYLKQYSSFVCKKEEK